MTNTDTATTTDTRAEMAQRLREQCLREGLSDEQTNERLRAFAIANGMSPSALILAAHGWKAGALLASCIARRPRARRAARRRRQLRDGTTLDAASAKAAQIMAAAEPAKTAEETKAARAEGGKKGGRGRKNLADNVSEVSEHGNKVSYLAARIRRDAPEIAAAVERGEYPSTSPPDRTTRRNLRRCSATVPRGCPLPRAPSSEVALRSRC